MKRSLKYTSAIALLSGLFIFGPFQNCGDQVRFEAGVDESLLQSQRAESLEILLSDLIKQERDERIAADDNLQSQIDQLNLDLAQLRETLEGRIDNLESSHKELEVVVAQQEKKFSQQLVIIKNEFTSITNQLNIDIKQVQNNLEITMNDSQEDFDEKLEALREFLSEQIADATGANEEEIGKNYQRILDLQAQLETLKQSHEDLKVVISTNYATKTDFEYLQGLYQDLVQVTRNIDLKIDRTAEELRAEMGAEIEDLMALISEMMVKIDTIDARVTDVDERLVAAIKDIKAEQTKMYEDIMKYIHECKESVLYIVERRDEKLRVEMLEVLRKEMIKMTMYTNKITSVLALKIKELEDQMKSDGALTSEQIKALEEAIAQAKKEAADAIALEQKHRQELQNQVDALAKTVEQIQKDLASTQALALENQKRTQELEDNFNKKIQELAAQHDQDITAINERIDQMNEDFEKKLSEVMEMAKDMVSDLGDTIQIEMGNLAAQISVLNVRISSEIDKMKQILVEFKLDEAKKTYFESNLTIIVQENSDGVADVIQRILELQRVFVDILNPDDRQLEHHDTTFNAIMQLCKGNPSLSFPNALGLDSYQFLTFEYVRHLLQGIRVNSDNDRVFNNFGSAFQGTGLHRHLVLGLTRQTVGSSQKTCLDVIANWANRLLLIDEETNYLRDRIDGNAELIIATRNLYTTLHEVKPALDKLDAKLKELVAGQYKSDELLENLRIKYSLHIIDFAQNHLMKANYVSRITNIYNQQVQNITNITNNYYNNTEELNKLEAQYNELNIKLDGFMKSYDARLDALESRVGSLEAAMRNVLNVLMTLADRAGYQDIVDYVVDTGKIINHTPVALPDNSFKPQCVGAQHFFGTLSQSYSGTCDGIKLLNRPNLCKNNFTYLAKKCWVNLRRVTNSRHVANSLHMRMFGAANMIQVTSDKGYNKVFDLSSSNGVKVHGQYAKGAFDLHVPGLAKYTRYISVQLKPGKKTSGGVTWGQSCNYRIKLYSPVILDFNGPEGVRPKFSSATDHFVKFDIDADGVKDQVSWVKDKNVAFLVKDQGKKGIDSALELFGDRTISSVNNQPYANGYEALKFYDYDGSGFIDQENELSELKLWFDRDFDGVSDEGELVSLSSMGVKKIRVSYSSQKIDEFLSAIEGVELRYSSDFVTKSGSLCENGCSTYDAYFAKVEKH